MEKTFSKYEYELDCNYRKGNVLRELSSVFGVIDAQGYIKNGKFVPVEISIVTDISSECLELSVDVPQDRTNKWLYNHYHRLPFVSLRANAGFPTPSEADVIDIINVWRGKFWQPGKDSFAVKNNHLAKLLEDNGFTFINLEEEKYKCPSIDQLDLLNGNVWFCSFHDLSNVPIRMRATFHCALRRATCLMKWIKSKANQQYLLDMLQSRDVCGNN